MSSPQVVEELLEWMRTHDAPESLLQIQYLGEAEGHGVCAKQPLTKGQTTLEIPFKLTMTIDSAAESDLKPITEALDMPPDELLALHLMHERNKGAQSFYAPFIASIPKSYDMPVFWNQDDLKELTGTNVLLLTNMMKRQLAHDFENLHTPLLATYASIFTPYPELTLKDYEWAMSVIWSRAFGVTKDQRYLHVLCPAMDMFNHDVHLLNDLDDFVSYEETKNVMQHRVAFDVASSQTPISISYGQYSNAKLLYSYGFVVPGNRVKGLDFWMKVPPSDPYQRLKQHLLDSNQQTSNQTYDFKGTLYEHDIDERLLNTLRVILMTEQEIRQKLFKQPFMFSARNEQAVYETLQSVLQRKLSNYPTSMAEDEALLLDARANRNARLAFAVQVRLEDKQVLAGAIQTLAQWKSALEADPTAYPPLKTRRAEH